jgi:hypothetical protein
MTGNNANFDTAIQNGGASASSKANDERPFFHFPKT